jgi:diguanylate cyclase (GGDEF)-like protein
MSPQLILTQDIRQQLAGALTDLQSEVHGLPHRLNQALQGTYAAPAELVAFEARIESLIGAMQGNESAKVRMELNPEATALLRTALAFKRRRAATQIQRGQATIADATYSQAIAHTLEPLDAVLELPWLAETPPHPIPRLADFLTRQGVESLVPRRPSPPDEFDPKHKTLLSSSQIPRDLEMLRWECDERHRPLGVVFADLDDFKLFNEDLGEVRVDQVVLPTILRAVERAAFGHGRAYRHGGDEFVILLPNASIALASAIALQIRDEISPLRFAATERAPSISIGIWMTAPESHLTDNELIEAAAAAKKAAKRLGKRRTVVRQEVGSRYHETVFE